jgi:hypothetical protein
LSSAVPTIFRQSRSADAAAHAVENPFLQPYLAHAQLSLAIGLLLEQSLNYLFLGEGETGLMVYTILVRYWEWAGTDPAHRPALYLTSS